MGWRTETREAVRRCEPKAADARADAEEARSCAAGMPAGPDREAVLRAAEEMDAAAADFTDTAHRNRRTLNREWSR
jgi:hypothetical protein